MDTLIESNGRRFGRYVLLGHLADGGMASVYLAQLRGNNRFSKWAALKVVHRRHAGNDRFQKMFLTEARIVAQIDHPNVATVFDCGEDAGTYYLAMEYLTGQTLRKVSQQAVLRDRPVPLPLAARIIADAASGLHAAHELKGDDGESAGIVHRDVSPHNIFVLYSGGTKIMDFGIAFSNSRSDDEHTEIDELKGKIAYMSPEQLQRFPLDRRSDIFSLGIVLWELVAASRLFKRPTEGKAALAIIRDSVDAPSTMRHDCPPELDRIVLKALAKMPEDRYETAADLAADLEEYIISTGRAAGSPMLREYMHELFAEEIEEHSTSLRKASELVRQVEAELDLTATSSDEGPTVEIDVSTAQPRARAGPMTWLLAGVVIAASGVGAWTMFQSWMGPSAELDGEEGTVQVASPPVAEEAVAAAEHEGDVERTADTEPAIAVDTERAIDPEPVRAIDAESARGAAAVAELEPEIENDDARPRARGRWQQRRATTPTVVAAEERVAPSPPQNANPTPTPTGPRPMTEFE